MGPRLTKLHDPDRNFLVRCCMTVAAAVIVVPGSVVRQCEECDIDIWYSPNQVLPVMPGIDIEGEVLLCLPCTMYHQSMDEDPKWLGPRPPGLT